LSDRAYPNGPGKRAILHIGQIGRPHGLNGEIKVKVISSDPERFDNLGECLLVSRDEKSSRPVTIEYARPGGSQIIVKLHGIVERSQAEPLNGCFLSVPRDKAMPLQQDQWFICELIGCQVVDDRQGDLGTLKEIIQSGCAQDIFVVSAPGQPDLLFPGLKSILLQVDPGRLHIAVHLPDGLYEVYREKES
jgi:16S rRNA processing protein RimM